MLAYCQWDPNEQNVKNVIFFYQDTITVCRLFGAKPLSKLMLAYCQWDPNEQNVKNMIFFYQDTKKNFIHENVSEHIVCEMAAFLSRGRGVNP